jgi:hypothetical protein
MISVPSGVRVWLAGGVTDMRRGDERPDAANSRTGTRLSHAGGKRLARRRRSFLGERSLPGAATACNCAPSFPTVVVAPKSGQDGP